MKRYLDVVLYPVVMILLGVTWLLPEGLAWSVVSMVLDLLLLVVLICALARRRTLRRQEPSSAGEEGNPKRVYTWQYWTYRVLFTIAAALYIFGGLFHLILGFCSVNNDWCSWLFAAGLAASVVSLPLAIWDEAIDPA